MAASSKLDLLAKYEALVEDPPDKEFGSAAEWAEHNAYLEIIHDLEGLITS